MGCSFGGFYTHIRKHWHSGVLQVRPSQVGKIALCRREISSPFFRPYLISPQGSPGVQPRPPAVLLMLRMKPELVSFLRSVFCCQSGSRTESAINSPCKHQLNLHSLSFPTLPFSVLQHLFCSLNGITISISTWWPWAEWEQKVSLILSIKKWLRPSRQVQLQHLVLSQHLHCYFSTVTVVILRLLALNDKVQRTGLWSAVLPITARLYDTVWGTLWTLLAVL